MANALSDWLKKSLDTVMLTSSFAVAFAIGIVVVLTQQRGATAVLWALASMCCGGLVGFLFGIPRVLQQDGAAQPRGAGAAAAPATGTSTEDRAASSYRLQVNTNLEQISDWLTKIIVGVGLIELGRAPDLLRRASRFIGEGFTPAPGAAMTAQSFAAAIVVYFGAVGFLGGYLMTRVYLAGAFKRADEGIMVNIGGASLTVAEVNAQIRSTLGDLQSQVLVLREQQTAGPPAAGAVTLRAADRTPTVRSILWVDDYPKNNSVIIDHLNRMGVRIVTAQSTDQAMRLLEAGTFDRIISDMGRAADVGSEKAGVEMVKRIRGSQAPYRTIPIVIYCSTTAAQRFGAEAKAAGAKQVTPSQTELIEALDLYS
jgi:CheY-like chemotaxis protein